MKNIFLFFLKELKIQLKYRFVWINRFLTPFSMMAPFVFIFKIADNTLEGFAVIGVVVWYWVNQFFFGVGSAFDDERHEGTLVSIVASPMPLWKILVAKGLYMFCEMVLITILTLFLFYIFEIKKGITIYVFFSFLFSGIYIFGFSILFSALVLIFRQLDSANYVIQYIFSILSGMTADVSKFPKIVKSISFSLPMTYLIIISRGISSGINIQFLIKNIIIVTIITFLYSILGLFLLKKAEQINRKNGSWEIW